MDISHIERRKKILESASALDVIQWIYDEYAGDVGAMTALGYSGVIMMDLARKVMPEFSPYFIDTGYHFPETLTLLNELQNLWGITFNVIKPHVMEDELKSIIGEKPWEQNADLCCHYMKVEPMLRILHEKKFWLSALRRDQSQSRAKIDKIEVDGRGTIKIYPLADWTFDQCWDYIHKNDLPYNELHDRHYPSVGCIHCTSPVKSGEHERAGRWNSMPKLECGIHLHKDNLN